MGDMEKAVQRVMRNAKELWVEMGLNSEQCAARMNHFTENIEAALDNLLRQVCFVFPHKKFRKHDKKTLITQQHRKSLNVMQSVRDSSRNSMRLVTSASVSV